MAYNTNQKNEELLNKVTQQTNISKQALINICVDLALPMLQRYFEEWLIEASKESLEKFKSCLVKVIEQVQNENDKTQSFKYYLRAE